MRQDRKDEPVSRVSVADGWRLSGRGRLKTEIIPQLALKIEFCDRFGRLLPPVRFGVLPSSPIRRLRTGAKKVSRRRRPDAY
jgi:hypothetical protein